MYTVAMDIVWGHERSLEAPCTSSQVALDIYAIAFDLKNMCREGGRTAFRGHCSCSGALQLGCSASASLAVASELSMSLGGLYLLTYAEVPPSFTAYVPRRV